MRLASLEKWFLRCDVALAWLAVLATLALMLLTTADAASRYLLNSPITGAYEITEKYLMVAGIFLGFAYAYRRGVFIRVTFLVDRLPPALKLIFNYVVQIISLAYCLIFVFATLREALRATADGTTLSTVPLPVAPAYFLVPVGFFAMTVFMLFDLARVHSGESALFREDQPTS
jgi:TRAP-type C4-dicarboxylate transport system permease small subunit